MRDNDHRTLQGHHNPLDHVTRAYFHGGGCLVHDEDFWAAEECACKADELTLTEGERAENSCTWRRTL